MKDSKKKKEEKSKERSEEMISLTQGLGEKLESLEKRMDVAVNTMDQYNLQNYNTVFSNYAREVNRHNPRTPSAPSQRPQYLPLESDRLINK